MSPDDKSSAALRSKLNAKKEEAERQKKEALEQQKILEARLKRAFDAVASTVEGRIVLRHLSNICGFAQPKAAANMETRCIDPVTTTYNAAMENVYLKVRRLISKQYLKTIELEDDKEGF